MSSTPVTYRHGGDLREMAEIAGCDAREILDFSANVHPNGFPDWLRMTLSAEISGLVHYPDPSYHGLREKISRSFAVPTGEIAVGNGASELLHAVPRALALNRAVLPVPSYVDYDRALRASGCEVLPWSLGSEDGFAIRADRLSAYLRDLPDGAEVRTGVFLGNPSNPTGTLLAADGLRSLARTHPGIFFVVDEAFIDFADPEQSLRRDRPANVVVVSSWTKLLALPGLRMAALFAEASVCRSVQEVLPTWAVNSLAAAVMERALDDAELWSEAARKTREWREPLFEELSSVQGLKPRLGTANFLLVELVDPKRNASELRDCLLRKHRIGIRDCSNYVGLGSAFFRVAVRRQEENARLVRALSETMEMIEGVQRKVPKPRRKTPALMFQGTGSNVGKSILTAALCRILYQDGLRVAPFKAQNMALNSFVTPDGGEIGRAQALQAQAAKLAPDVRMNPVLLKPSNEKGSQVILNGRPVAHMDYTDYARFKPVAFEAVRRAYDSLSEEFDVMVLEGAGSASEVNLKKHEIVNMRMARHAEARVLLVGNIDYGGVFGAMVGTLETMAEWERELVAGFVINRFRGTKALLAGGLEYLREYTGKPVFGVVPHIAGLRLPEEDSLEFKSGVLSDESPLGERIDVALIDMPRISNFTDVDALRIEPDVRVRHVRAAAQLGAPDVIVLPGSKNVVTDLDHLRENGLASRILELAREGKTEIVGICGGFQMLGERVLDPHGIETSRPRTEALGLLPLETTLELEKQLRQTDGIHLESGTRVVGYEIHHGVTRELSPLPMLVQSSEGLSLAQGHAWVWGTYLHGIFDADEFRRGFLDRIRSRKGWRVIGEVQARYNLEKGLDELACEVRESLDMKQIYRLLDRGLGG